MSLYVTGDTHGDVDFHKLNSKRFNKNDLTKSDYVLICGDCAAVWDKGGYDRYIQQWYDKKPWTTLYVDGNHENHDALDKYPVVEWNGGRVHRISDSIIHLMRGQVYTIDGHKIFTMGGASSHDKAFRKEGLSWWARELPSNEEYDEAIQNLTENGNKVDYIFTHCASTPTIRKISSWYEPDEMTEFLGTIENIDFKHWYFGHYHEDRQIDERHTAIYDDIVKLW